MSGPGHDEPVSPVIAIVGSDIASAGLVMTSIEETLAFELEWSEDEKGVFGQASATGGTSTIDIDFRGEGTCSIVRIVAGSCGERPAGGHWRRTLDVTGMSPAIAALPRIQRAQALTRLCRRILDEAVSERALRMAFVNEQEHLQAGRRHARLLAAEAASLTDVPIAPLAEARVRHPYAGAPGIVQITDGRGWLRKAEPCGVRLPALGSVAFVGTGTEGTLYVSGTLRTASLSAHVTDPMTMLRLLKELENDRARMDTEEARD
jgi:hypothetical protein